MLVRISWRRKWRKNSMPQKPSFQAPNCEWYSDWCQAEIRRMRCSDLPHGGKATVQLGPGKYHAEWFNATSGQRYSATEDVTGPSWTSSNPPDEAGSPDWAILLRKQCCLNRRSGPYRSGACTLFA